MTADIENQIVEIRASFAFVKCKAVIDVLVFIAILIINPYEPDCDARGSLIFMQELGVVSMIAWNCLFADMTKRARFNREWRCSPSVNNITLTNIAAIISAVVLLGLLSYVEFMQTCALRDQAISIMMIYSVMIAAWLSVFGMIAVMNLWQTHH